MEATLNWQSKNTIGKTKMLSNINHVINSASHIQVKFLNKVDTMVKKMEQTPTQQPGLIIALERLQLIQPNSCPSGTTLFHIFDQQ